MSELKAEHDDYLDDWDADDDKVMTPKKSLLSSTKAPASTTLTTTTTAAPGTTAPNGALNTLSSSSVAVAAKPGDATLAASLPIPDLPSVPPPVVSAITGSVVLPPKPKAPSPPKTTSPTLLAVALSPAEKEEVLQKEREEKGPSLGVAPSSSSVMAASYQRHQSVGGHDLNPLTDAEVAEINLWFKKYDVDKNNTIDKKELMDMLKQLQFSYNEQYIGTLFTLTFSAAESSNQVVDDRTSLTKSEFMIFMQIFLNLHDIIHYTIEKKFHEMTGSMLSPEMLEIFMHDITISEAGELNFTSVFEDIKQALDEETAKLRQLEEQRREEQKRQQKEDEARNNAFARPLFVAPVDPHRQLQQQQQQQQQQLDHLQQQEQQQEHNQRQGNMPRSDSQNSLYMQQGMMQRSDSQNSLSRIYSNNNLQSMIMNHGGPASMMGALGGSDTFSPYATPKKGGGGVGGVSTPSQAALLQMHLASAGQHEDGAQKQMQINMAAGPGHLGQPAKVRSAAYREKVRVKLQGELRRLQREENEHLQRCFDVFLRFFDKYGQGMLTFEDVNKCLISLGLEFSIDQLRHMCAQADVSKNGLSTFEDFRHYYLVLFWEHLKNDSTERRLRNMFMELDAQNAKPTLTPHELAVGIKKWCAERGSSDLSDQNAMLFVRLADMDGDGAISMEEFSSICSIITNQNSLAQMASAAAASPPDQGGAAVAGMPSQSAMTVEVISLLLRQIVRVSMPNPVEILATMAYLPEHYRFPILPPLERFARFKLSTKLRPVLDHTGLQFKHLRYDHVNRVLHAVPTDLRSRAKPRGIGGPGGGQNLGNMAGGFITGGKVADELGAFGEQETHIALQISVDRCEGIPIPDTQYRKDVVSHRVRCCMFDNRTPISNVHTVKAAWNDDEEDVWTFPPSYHDPADDTPASTVPTGEWNKMIVKTNRQQTSILFELTVLIQKNRFIVDQTMREGGISSNIYGSSSSSSTSSSSSSSSGSGNDRVSNNRKQQSLTGFSDDPRDYFEFCVGWAQLDINTRDLLDSSQDIERTVELPIIGGTYRSRTPIKDKDILARRKGWFHALKSNLGNKKVTPRISVTVSPLSLIKSATESNERLQNFIRMVPFDSIVPTNACRLVRNFYEIVGENLLVKSVMPLKLGLLHSPAIVAFLRVVDNLDELQIMRELWEKTRLGVSRFDRRDVGGGTNNLIKALFSRCLLQMASVHTSSSRSIPPLTMGLNDIQRLRMMRMILDSDPLQVLGLDGLLKGIKIPGVNDTDGVLKQKRPGFVKTPKPAQVGDDSWNPDEIDYENQHRGSLVGRDGRAAQRAQEDQRGSVMLGSTVEAPTALPLHMRLVHKPFKTEEVAFDHVGSWVQTIEAIVQSQKENLEKNTMFGAKSKAAVRQARQSKPIPRKNEKAE